MAEATTEDVEDGAKMRQMEMLTIPLPPASGLTPVTSSFVSVWSGGGGNVLNEEPEQIFLDNLLDETNIASVLPEFQHVKTNPQCCDRLLKLDKSNKDGNTRISEIRLSKKGLTG